MNPPETRTPSICRAAVLPCWLAGLMAPALGAAEWPGTAEAYLVPTHSGVHFRPILTAGDSVPAKAPGRSRYRMVGIPDGLGLIANPDGSFTLLMNHELWFYRGIARAH